MTFERVYTFIIDNSRCPQLAPKNTHTVHEWLANGYSAEKDIIPAVEESCKWGTKTIFSFGYFTHAIKRKHEERLKHEAANPGGIVPPERIAEIKAWKEKMGLI